MKKLFLLAGITAIILSSCSTDEKYVNDSISGNKVTLNATIPNSGTRVSEVSSDTYGLITNWNSDDSINVLVNANTIVPMGNSTGNFFTATSVDPTVEAGFAAGQTIYGVNNKYNDKITTVLNGSQLNATIDYTLQNGTVSNLAKYDLMYGSGDPTGSITFNHKICILRLDINSDSLKADGVTSISDMKLRYVVSSGSQLFASKEVFNFGAASNDNITGMNSIYLQNTNIAVASGIATVYIAVPQRTSLNGTLYISMKGVTGTNTSKIYNLTNPISLSNARMLKSTVHPQAITKLSRAKLVGGYLFSDGWWGSLSDSIVGSVKPIAVIFSKTTSTTDQGKGWTHGYAMALKNASTSAAWGPGSGNPTGAFFATTATEIADKDGYTHNTFIKTTTNQAGYAAFVTYKSVVAAPSNTSGWFLPSSGQLYDICVNLGKITTAYTNQTTNFYWAAKASTCATNINAYLTPLASGTYDTFPWSSTVANNYWSSSEYNSTNVNYTSFSTNGNLVFNYSLKTSTYKVRAVIAF